MFGCLYFTTHSFQSVRETLGALYRLRFCRSVNWNSKPVWPSKIFLFIIFLLCMCYILFSQKGRKLRLFKQQTFHPFCCSVIGFVKESSSTSLYILHVCFRVFKPGVAVEFCSYTRKCIVHNVEKESFNRWEKYLLSEQMASTTDEQSLSGKAFCLRLILLCFSVYSAHSHYEIFHNVEALRGNRMEIIRKQLPNRSTDQKTLYCYKVHERVKWSPWGRGRGGRGEGHDQLGGLFAFQNVLMSLFYQKSIKVLRNWKKIFEVLLLDMTAFYMLLLLLAGAVVTIIKPKRVHVTPSFISWELTCSSLNLYLSEHCAGVGVTKIHHVRMIDEMKIIHNKS